MPVNWIDGVTDVNAANLEIMEADTAAAQAGADNAYSAALDAQNTADIANSIAQSKPDIGLVIALGG